MNAEQPNHQHSNEREVPPKFNADGGDFTVDDQNRISYLERLQSDTTIGTDKWGPEHARRLKFLREKRDNAVPSQAQLDRFYELDKLQFLGGKGWTEDLAEEMRHLYLFINKHKKH